MDLKPGRDSVAANTGNAALCKDLSYEKFYCRVRLQAA
jgi:hypothetical protein